MKPVVFISSCLDKKILPSLSCYVGWIRRYNNKTTSSDNHVKSSRDLIHSISYCDITTRFFMKKAL